MRSCELIWETDRNHPHCGSHSSIINKVWSLSLPLTNPAIGYLVGSASDGGKDLWGSPPSSSDMWGNAAAG